MKNVEIKFTNQEILAFGLPENATTGSAGLDLRAFPSDQIQAVEVQKDENDIAYFEIKPNEVIKVSTGIAMHLADPTLVGLIYPRSGTSTKRGIVLANTTGVIDSDYTGEIILALRNQSNEVQKVLVGERVAQLVITPVVPCVFNAVAEFTKGSERADGGFGSSGKM